ncbi:hypothetical protein C8J56DRAFT_1177161 [Mycena floridula]|nr:hypothetical protein C8J56DRAFT_1177161 [Mycena floridula]
MEEQMALDPVDAVQVKVEEPEKFKRLSGPHADFPPDYDWDKHYSYSTGPVYEWNPECTCSSAVAMKGIIQDLENKHLVEMTQMQDQLDDQATRMSVMTERVRRLKKCRDVLYDVRHEMNCAIAEAKIARMRNERLQELMVQNIRVMMGNLREEHEIA